MFTTVYALWNCYVITLLILYAPSHKEGSNIIISSIFSMKSEALNSELSMVNGAEWLSKGTATVAGC